MAGSSPPNIPDTLNVLYFGTLLAAILWSSRHDIRTAVISLAALTMMGLVTPFLGSPDPAFVHVVYLSVTTFAVCMSDPHDTASTTSVQGLVSDGTTLASIGKALLVGPVVLLGGVLRLPVTILRVIFSGAMVFGRSFVAVIRGVIYAIRSIAVAAVCVARGAFYITAFSFGMSKRMWTAGSKCIRITGVVTQCIWGLLVAPFAVGKGLVTALVAVLRNALWLVAVTFSFGFRGTVFAARFASKSLILVSHASVIASISIVAVSKRVLLAVRKCTQAKSKPTEHESARVVRVVLCPDDYVISAPLTDAPVTAPLLRHFDTGILVALVILSALRDVLLATASVVDRVPDLVTDASLSVYFVLSIGLALVGYFTMIPIAFHVTVADVQDVSNFAKLIFSDMRNIPARVVDELTVATAVALHYFSFLNATDIVPAPVTIALACSLQLVPCAVNKRIKCATLVVRRRPLRFYAISPHWLEALRTRLYLRLISRSLIATDYFRMIARQFEIPSALASAVSRPGVPAVVKKPLAVLALPRLLVRLAKDGGNLASTVVVYDRLEKMLLSTIRVSGIPRSLFASDHFRMVAQQFAAPTVLVPFIGPLVRQLDSPGAHANPISNSRALSVVRTPLAICDIPSLAVEMVQVNDPTDSIVVYKANARSEKTIVTRGQVSGIEPSLFATDHFRMIVQQFVILIILASLAGPPLVPEADIALTAFIEEVEDDTIEGVLSDDSSVDMDASTLLDVSLSTDMVEYAVVKSEKPFTPLAFSATPDPPLAVVPLALDALPSDLDTTLVETSAFIEAVDDDIPKNETTESGLLEASRGIDAMGNNDEPEDLSAVIMPVVGSVSSPSTEDQIPGSALASLEGERTEAMIDLDVSPLIDLADTDTVQSKEPTMLALSSAAHVSGDPSVGRVLELDCSGFFDSLLVDVISTDVAQLWPLIEVDTKTQGASADSSIDTLLESIPATVEITDDSAAQRQETVLSDITTDISPDLSVEVPDLVLKTCDLAPVPEVSGDNIVKPQQSPALSACDPILSEEAPHLTLDVHLSDADAEPSCNTADVVVEHDQALDAAVVMTNLYAAALELVSEMQLVQLVDALVDIAFIDETAQLTVDPSPLPVAVVKANKSSTVTPIDDDDEPIDPPFEVPLPPLLIVSEFIARYVCMVSVCSEIPRIYSLYTFRPIGQEPEEVVLYRTTRVFVAEVQWGEELVREKRRLVFKVSRTSVEVSVQDYRETSCRSGFTVVARNSLSVETQRFLKFLRLVYGLVVKRQRKRHPRARGGRKVQEAKARKAMKEAARLARLAEEDSCSGEALPRIVEEATLCTGEEVIPCTAEEVDVEAPASLAVEAEAEVTAASPADEEATFIPAPEAPASSQLEVPTRRRRNRARHHTANGSVGDNTKDLPARISSTIPEEGTTMSRIVENALQEAAGSSGTAPPRAGCRRSRRRTTTS